MAGRKNFVAGEILTAADVNSFLMDQSVMVFDDSAARGSAIPTPTEGMVTYLKSDDQVTVFDGAAFKPVGGLVAVKSAIRTTPTSASVTAGNNFSVPDLSITHEVQDPANKLIISAFFGIAGSGAQQGQCGIGVAQDGTLIGVGTSVGSRQATGAGGRTGANNARTTLSPSVTFVHTPGAGEKTYTVRAINIVGSTQTLFINRAEDDSNAADSPRGASAFVIQEVAV